MTAVQSIGIVVSPSDANVKLSTGTFTSSSIACASEVVFENTPNATTTATSLDIGAVTGDFHLEICNRGTTTVWWGPSGLTSAGANQYGGVKPGTTTAIQVKSGTSIYVTSTATCALSVRAIPLNTSPAL
jgi:UPF0288 family protein (methanogenesis marker protein 3)